MIEDPLRQAVEKLADAEDGDSIAVNASGLLTFLAEKMSNLKCYQHPLGFVHAELTPLLELPQRFRVRLHMWRDENPPRDTLGLRHDHAWSLTSLVLLGQLTDLTFVALPDPAGLYEGFRVAYGRVNTFTSDRRYDVRETCRRTVTSGLLYKIPPRTIHQTKVEVAPLATLLLSEEDSRGIGPLVFGRYPSQGSGTGVRKEVSVNEVEALLRDLARLAR